MPRQTTALIAPRPPGLARRRIRIGSPSVKGRGDGAFERQGTGRRRCRHGCYDRPIMDASESTDVAARVAALDWSALEQSLWDRGYAKTPPLLDPDECAALCGLYDDDGRFRSRVDMARHRFGQGEYKYFAHPLPPL